MSGEAAFVEQEIWKSFQEGNEDAFAQIMRKFTVALTYYGRKMTPNDDLIKDCVQETFIEIWQYRKGLSNLTEIRPYLFTCLRRKIIRAIKRNNFTELDGKEDFFDVDFSVEQRLIASEAEAETVRNLNDLVNKLSKRRKEVIYLKFYQNLSNEEIAGVMEIKYQTATNLLHEALDSLRNMVPRHSIVTILAYWANFIN